MGMVTVDGVEHDIYDNRPRMETRDVQVLHVATKDVTKWRTELITQPQTVFEPSLISDPLTVAFAQFGSESVDIGGDITIDVGNDVELSGMLNSGGSFDITAGNDILIEGQLPDNAEEGNLPPTSKLMSVNGFTLESRWRYYLGTFI